MSTKRTVPCVSREFVQKLFDCVTEHWIEQRRGVEGECLIWVTRNVRGNMSSDTRGMVYVPGYGSLPVQRLIYRHFYGEIPEGGKVKRVCYLPRCINPHHLYLRVNGEDRYGTPKKLDYACPGHSRR